MRLKVSIIIILGFIFLLSEIKAQQLITLQGLVTDNTTGEPVPFASICIVGTAIGTVTNYTGNFIIKIPDSLTFAEFKVAHMAYTSVTIRVSEFIANPKIIRLSTEIYLISAINIKANRAEDTLLKALERIPINYPDKAQFFRAYYREQITENKKVIQLNEAIFRVYKAAYNSNEKDAIQLIKGRAHTNVFNTFLWNYLEFVNGPYEMLYSDFVKHSRQFIQVPQNGANFLDPKNFEYYTYSLIRQTNLNNEPELVIYFKPKKKSNKAKFEGSITLEDETLAFKQLRYTIADSRINSVRLIPASTDSYLSSKRFNNSAFNYATIINFRKVNGKWQFSHAKMWYGFIIYGGVENVFALISNEIDFIFTDLEVENLSPIKPHRALAMHKALETQFNTETDDFWENYNYLQIEN